MQFFDRKRWGSRVLIFQLPNGETYYLPKFQLKLLKIKKVRAIFENRNFYGAVKNRYPNGNNFKILIENFGVRTGVLGF